MHGPIANAASSGGEGDIASTRDKLLQGHSVKHQPTKKTSILMKTADGSKVLRRQQHGQYIYAYCHINTNQVVYSLKRSLNNHSARKQLPDVGANNKPRALRKDQWRPFFTLTFPETTDGNAQGLHAYKKLIEWRKLHETSWTPSPLLSRPYTEDEIKAMKDKLANRGGSKEESVHDLIKREKKKMRIREVRDQKANSVADLATVLIDQDVMGSKSSEQREQEQKMDRETEVKQMLELSSAAEQGGLQKLDGEVKAKEEQLEQMMENGHTGSRAALRREIQQLRGKRWKMQFSVDAVSRARTAQQTQVGAQRETLKQAPAAVAAGEAIKKTPSNTTEAGTTDAATTAPSSPQAGIELTFEQLTELLPSFPQRSLEDKNMPKRGHLRRKLERMSNPVFSTKGVQVSWQNMLDAEFAAEWPEDVEHVPMGFVRHTASRPGGEPALDIEQLRTQREEDRKAQKQHLADAEAQLWRQGGDKTPALEKSFKSRQGPLQSALMQVASKAFDEKKRRQRMPRKKLAGQTIEPYV